MKVVRVVAYHENLKLDSAPEPKITSPLDVIVKIGAAGVCRVSLPRAWVGLLSGSRQVSNTMAGRPLYSHRPRF